MSEQPDLETVVGLLDDDPARTILAATSTGPMSATELAQRADVSRQTVYRRLDRLEAAGLVTTRTRPRSDGHHDEVYEATFAGLRVRLADGTFEFEIELEDGEETDAADELERLWRNFP